MAYTYTPPPKKTTRHWYDDLPGGLLQVGGGALGAYFGGPVGAAIGSQLGGVAASAADPEYGSRSSGIVPIAASLSSYGIGKAAVNAGMNQAATAATGVAEGMDKYSQGLVSEGARPENAMLFAESRAMEQLAKQPTFMGGVTMDQYAGYHRGQISDALLKDWNYRRMLRDGYMKLERHR